jgi:hypothetical protein
MIITGTPLNAPQLIENVRELRRELHALEIVVSSIKAGFVSADLTERPGVAVGAAPADRGEMLANATLAYRHLEDARMRLGKVIQAYDGGVSVYDKKSEPKSPVDLGGTGRFG